MTGGGGIVGLVAVLDADPRRTTHQAKRIVRRGGAGSGGPLSLADDPELVAARDAYAKVLAAWAGQLKRRKDPPRLPLAGPLQLDVTFCFPNRPGEEGVAWLADKPDRDNVLKTFQDALVVAGLVGRDERVVCGATEKIRGPRGWIRVAIAAAPAGLAAELYAMGVGERDRI